MMNLPDKERSGPYGTDRMSVGTKVGIATASALGVLIGVLVILGALAPPTARSDGTTVTTSTTAASGNQGAAVTVDVRAGEYFFKSALTMFKVAVHYHFVVHNVGAIPHECMLVQPIAPGMMSMEEMDKMAMGHIEFSDLQAHQSATSM